MAIPALRLFSSHRIRSSTVRAQNIIGSAIKEDYATLVKQARKAQSRALFACKFGESDNVVVVEFGDSKANQESGVVTAYDGWIVPTGDNDPPRVHPGRL